ncbi:UDP-3-O-(3-hydroxymyristoyl)glucosamine N-acyltransferase [Solitalea lacus]|uniref:UDP-3-O-(3-hydroxymyristoyl)glucosamine N-acyltransferase n=1 Tax=Solitalea lacus TaxID=2911172 RepID=UPI001EDC1E47|nr:UDP-3-O-(3-hydroxymyristoyl)glucosamine N-acyltransferase [Solitalea lacus]UKJ09395.1 UDP-3-O-(3-hydroxymyristoyl)glucosamine N-acyltransferase [Solitalea lacus]
MLFTAAELGQLLNGVVEGNPDVTVSTLAKIEEGTTGALSFLANPKYLPHLYTTNSSVVIVNKDLVLTGEVLCTLIRVDDAYSAFSILLEKYNTIKQNKSGIEQPSYISQSATVGDNLYLGAFAYIGNNAKIGQNVKIYPQAYIGDNVKIGDNTTIFAGVKIYSDCVIGNNVIIHSGTVIGSDGFGFAPQADGTYTKVAQIGNVVIEDNVEIGSNTSIDRATMGSTIIGKGVKIDNLIQIAHNVEIGANTVLAAQSGVSGSTKVGENCVIGGQVGIVGHITIAKGSQFGAQSGVHRTIEEEGKKWNGSPIVPYFHSLKTVNSLPRLPELERKVSELEKQLKELLGRK